MIPEDGEIGRVQNELFDEVDEFRMKRDRVKDLGQRRVLHERERQLAHACIGLQPEPV